jgi:hypothetical protein
MKSSLFLAVVDSGKADGLMRSAKKAGSKGGTVLTARAITSSSLLCLLGLGDSRKEILLMMVDEPDLEQVWGALVGSKHFKGTAAAFNASWEAREPISTGEHTWDLLAVICNNGLGDDILTAVRRVEPVGGLIIDGRGTAQQEDVPFFWAHLVPEKELVLAFIPNGATQQVLTELSALKALQQEGSGIAFTLPALQVAVTKR